MFQRFRPAAMGEYRCTRRYVQLLRSMRSKRYRRLWESRRHKTQMTIKLRIAVLSVLSILPLFGQIEQLHPELCGKPDQVIAAPSNISIVLDRSLGSGDLYIKGTSLTTKISIPGVIDDVDQVCPLSDGRFVFFGGTYNSSNIIVVDNKTASLVDAFYGFDPLMSGDQRWIVYRKFYPIHTEEPTSEEYLLYDLTKTPAEQRPPGMPRNDDTDVGTPIFPLGATNSLADNIGLAPNQQHRFGSKRFYWAPNSRAILFGDRVQGKFSIVLVRLDDKGNATTLVHPVPLTEVCARETIAGGPVLLSIDQPVTWANEGTDRSMRVTVSTSESACAPKTLELHVEDFRPAEPEIHVSPKRKRAVVLQR